MEVATLMNAIQGVLAGLSILATSVGLLYLTSLAGLGIQFEVDNTWVEIKADHRAAVAAPAQAALAEPAAVALAVPTAVAETADLAVDEARTVDAPDLPAGVALDYYNLIAPDISAVLVSLGRISVLLENPRAEEDGWRQNVVQSIDMLRMGHEQLTHTRPPAEANELHTFLLASTERCLGVMTPLSDNLGGVPPELLTVVGKTLQRCIGETKSVVQQIY